VKKAKALASVANGILIPTQMYQHVLFYKWESTVEEICRSNLYVNLINPP
jgi:hypothetical protein